MTEFQSVNSSNIFGVSYNSEAEMLIVEFRSGKKYRYGGVPQEEFDDFMASPSKGAFFAANIRDAYPYSPV